MLRLTSTAYHAGISTGDSTLSNSKMVILNENYPGQFRLKSECVKNGAEINYTCEIIITSQGVDNVFTATSSEGHRMSRQLCAGKVVINSAFSIHQL